MKLYETYCKVVESIKPIKLAWFTTFNLDSELFEKYLLAPIGNVEHSTLRTAEDFEALNVELKNTKADINVWYDYRALNLRSPKRTTVPFVSVDIAQLYKIKSSGAVFHPKVILLIGGKEAYLICGSANLSFAAWSNNCEAVIIKRVTARKNAEQLLKFFSGFTNDTEQIREWITTLKNTATDWDFVATSGSNNVFADSLGKQNKSLSVWSPYFAANTIGLCQKFLERGFSNIELVPDVSGNGKVRILTEQLSEAYGKDQIAFLKRTGKDETARLYHAKVWLTPENIAIGSWNFSCRATGIGIAPHEQNFEAGIITGVEAKTSTDLRKALLPFELHELSGSSTEEIEKEWKQVLNDFTFSCIVKADWSNFTYILNEEFRKEGFSIALPHLPDKNIPLTGVNNLSFRDNYIRVLKNKIFCVFDNTGKEVYKGYLQEIRTELRPVYNYNSLYDLLDALIESPSGETSRKRIAYSYGDGDGNPDDGTLFFDELQSSDSFYRMFVSFQKLFDTVANASDDQGQLDKIGFRIPGSLVNIIRLVKDSFRETKNLNDDKLLFYWFITQEVNRCLNLYNSKVVGVEKQIDRIDNSEILKGLELEEPDAKFIDKLSAQFEYGTA